MTVGSVPSAGELGAFRRAGTAQLLSIGGIASGGTYRTSTQVNSRYEPILQFLDGDWSNAGRGPPTAHVR
jgi:hypothetical protein